MTVENLRDFLKQQYPGEAWKAKVDRMSAQQVIAICNRINNKKECSK